MEAITSSRLMDLKMSIKLPSILIKEIEKYLTSEEILEELQKNENVNIAEAVIIRLFDSSRYETNRLLLDLNAEDTKRIVSKGYVKISGYSCPADPIFIKCKCCYTQNEAKELQSNL